MHAHVTASAAARQSAAEAGRDGMKTVKANTYTGLSLQEARQILNVQDPDDLEALRKVRLADPGWTVFVINFYVVYRSTEL